MQIRFANLNSTFAMEDTFFRSFYYYV